MILSFARFLPSAGIWRSHASKSSKNGGMRHQVEKRSDLSRSVTQSLSEPSEPGFSNNVPLGLYCLPPLDPKSYKSADLFRSFLSSNDERKTILELSGRREGSHRNHRQGVFLLNILWNPFVEVISKREGTPGGGTGPRISKHCLRRSQKDRAPSKLPPLIQRVRSLWDALCCLPCERLDLK